MIYITWKQSNASLARENKAFTPAIKAAARSQPTVSNVLRLAPLALELLSESRDRAVTLP